jgi:hypothetical protein
MIRIMESAAAGSTSSAIDIIIAGTAVCDMWKEDSFMLMGLIRFLEKVTKLHKNGIKRGARFCRDS